MKTRIHIKSEMSEIYRLAEAVVAFGKKNQVPQEIISDANLALEEFVSNIILYGYEAEERHPIEVVMVLEKEALIFEIRDSGKPFNPLERPDPDFSEPFDEREAGGMGIYLARSIMDQLHYKRDRDQNVLIMGKHI